MTKKDITYDAIILGAGGAGLMCAAVAGQLGQKILLLDHSDEPGKKILISGGGRCNFTNLDIHPDRFVSANPHFAKSALARYTQQNFIDLVERHKIAWHEKTLGQLFCDHSAKQIVKMLMDECFAGNVDICLGERGAEVQKTESGFAVATERNAYEAPALVVATGGQSIPKLGATGIAYDIARQFRMKVVEPRPALVPFTLGREEALFSELSGVATDTIVSNGKASFHEASLFTHKGLSGPAILQISNYWRNGETISVNFLPTHTPQWLVQAKSQHPRSSLKSVLSQHLPERLADTLARKLDQSGGNLADHRDADLQQIAHSLADWRFTPSGTEGFAKAEVTIGGVSTDELSSRSLESKKVSGLYFIGECVDVTGWLGGYNFQWAWSSGHAAGTALATA